jgi:hypothetical protein
MVPPHARGYTQNLTRLYEEPDGSPACAGIFPDFEVKGDLDPEFPCTHRDIPPTLHLKIG